MKRFIYIFCCICICSSVQSQVKWTLRECIDYAVEHNIDIKKQILKADKSKVEVSTSKNSRLPNLNASFDQNFNFGRSTTSDNASISKNSNNLTFSIGSSLPIFTGFKISNQIKMDKLNFQAALEGLNKAIENIELQVTSLYLDVLFKKEILKVFQDQAKLTAEQLDRTEVLYNSGKIPASQVYDMKAKLAEDELNITTSKNDLDIAMLNLSQALNLQEESKFDIKDPYLNDVITENQSSILPVNQIYRTAIAIKPHVKEAQLLHESSKKALKIAQSGYYPTLDFNVGYRTSLYRLYNAPNPEFKDQLKDNASQYIGFTLSIPIFNRFKVRNSVRSARIDILTRELELDLVKQDLYKEIEKAYQSAIAARSKYSSTEKATQAAEESFKYAIERYDVGKSTVFEFDEAQTKLLSSKSEQIQAKYDFLFRTKILDFYNGKPIDIQ